MKKKSINQRIVVFITFFLLTIGNGSYINSIFQNKIEYAGLALLLISTFLFQKKNIYILKKDIRIITCSIILTIGALHYNISSQSIIMIFLSSLLLMSYSEFSNCFVTDNKQVKLIGDALLCGMILNSIIGIITGTLGLSFNSKEAIFMILFQSGIRIKNYCGGIWLITFISYYIYYYRNNTINKHLMKLLILGLLILFSGSKGALLLVIIFVLGINFKKIMIFKKNQTFIFYSLLIITIGIASIYLYNNVFVNIPTYAYRMRGINKIIDIISEDYNRLIFGFSDIAYANTKYDYTINMRNYLGWESSIEMAYVNIIIKNGIFGLIIYFYLFKNILKSSKKITKKERDIIHCMVTIMLLSGFTETYIASIHYVVGPTLFCVIYGILQDKKCIKNETTDQEE